MSNFEEIEVESIWLKIRPHRLPRCTSSLLVAALYLAPSSSAEQVSKLIAHLKKNTENYLRRHPEGMLIITFRRGRSKICQACTQHSFDFAAC